MQIILAHFYLPKIRSIEVLPCVNLSLCTFLMCTCAGVINCTVMAQVRAGRNTLPVYAGVCKCTCVSWHSPSCCVCVGGRGKGGGLKV